MLIQRLPQVLIIQLQRMSPDMTAAVEFPYESNHLDVKNNLFAYNDQMPHVFELTGVCARFGQSRDFGHYVAYVPYNSKQWLRYNDHLVSVIDEFSFYHETLSTAYLLFYRRIDVV